MNKKSHILHSAASSDPATGALSIPIYHASTYQQKSLDTRQDWEYVRSGNPTRAALEALLAKLEGGHAGFAFASGMAAISAALTAYTKAGDHIVVTRDIYGGTYKFLTEYLNRFGVSHTFVDATNPDKVKQAIQPNTKILFLETPSNPTMQITDLRRAALIAKEHGLISMIDNTFMSPYLQRPLEFGIDISIHSATKFLGGHSDLLAGAVITSTEAQSKAVKFVQNICGGVLSPNDSWLLLRGIKTLSARMDVQSSNALILAEWLQKQSWVTQVYYPGLPTHSGYSIHQAQSDGAGAVVSVCIDSVERTKKILGNTHLWSVAVSLGGVESIMSYPWLMSHAAMPPSVRKELGITETLLRLSVGLEDVQDLIGELAAAIN